MTHHCNQLSLFALYTHLSWRDSGAPPASRPHRSNWQALLTCQDGQHGGRTENVGISQKIDCTSPYQSYRRLCIRIETQMQTQTPPPSPRREMENRGILKHRPIGETAFMWTCSEHSCLAARAAERAQRRHSAQCTVWPPAATSSLKEDRICSSTVAAGMHAHTHR